MSKRQSPKVEKKEIETSLSERLVGEVEIEISQQLEEIIKTRIIKFKTTINEKQASIDFARKMYKEFLDEIDKGNFEVIQQNKYFNNY